MGIQEAKEAIIKLRTLPVNVDFTEPFILKAKHAYVVIEQEKNSEQIFAEIDDEVESFYTQELNYDFDEENLDHLV